MSKLSSWFLLCLRKKKELADRSSGNERTRSGKKSFQNAAEEQIQSPMGGGFNMFARVSSQHAVRGHSLTGTGNSGGAGEGGARALSNFRQTTSMGIRSGGFGKH